MIVTDAKGKAMRVGSVVRANGYLAEVKQITDPDVDDAGKPQLIPPSVTVAFLDRDGYVTADTDHFSTEPTFTDPRDEDAYTCGDLWLVGGNPKRRQR